MSNRKPSFIDRVREHIFKVWPGQVLVPPPSATQPSGLDLVARELHRQRSERARVHQYNGEELARAAACYISADHLVVEHTGQDPWPWIGKDDRGELTRVEQLVKGAALAIREIERISSGGAPTMPITDPLTVNVRVNGKTYEAPWPKANRTTTEVAEVESPPSNSADAFRPGLPPLELRRVWREWEDNEGDIIHFTADGMEFDWSTLDGEPAAFEMWMSVSEFDAAAVRPHLTNWQHIESLAAAKVAADKQPWERELERLHNLFFTDPQPVEEFAGFNEQGEPLEIGTEGEPPWVLDWMDSFNAFTEADKQMLRSLWPIEKLRRVVESGQGEADVPEDVARRLGCIAPDGWSVAGFFRDQLGFKKNGTRGMERAKASVLSALHAAGNEMVTK